MPPSHHRQPRSQLPTLPTLFLFALTVLASPNPYPPTNAARAETPLSRRQESVGSSCAGSEGQWNCMTTSFQRCGSGSWSAVEQCALGTQCSPAGLTYEFHVDYANGYIGAGSQPSPSTSGGAPTAAANGGGRDALRLGLLGALGVLVAGAALA